MTLKRRNLLQTIDSLTQEKDKILQNVSDKEQTINALNVQITEKDHLVHEFEQKIAGINKNIQELNLEKMPLFRNLMHKPQNLLLHIKKLPLPITKAAVEKQVESLESEVESLQTKPKNIAVVNGRFDLSGNPDTMVVLPDDNSNYTELLPIKQKRLCL